MNSYYGIVYKLQIIEGLKSYTHSDNKLLFVVIVNSLLISR